jgi:hypothetical protein
MATKRQPSKQRRQTQNQKQRAALNARREAAASGQAPSGKVGGTTGSANPARGSVLSRLRGASSTGRAARTARTGGGTGTATGLPVGHRAAMSALFAAVAAAVVGSLLFKVPVDRSGEAIVTREALVAEWSLSAAEVAQDDPEATPAEVADAVDDWTPSGSEPYAQAFWPISAGVLLPVLGTGLGFRAVSRRSPAKLVNRTMYVTLFGALLASQLLLIFLPAVISLAVAAFQVRKAEVAANQAAAAGDDVVDVEEVEDVDEADDVIDVDEVEDIDEAPGADDGEPEPRA